MAGEFRRTTEPPVPEGYKKIGTLYQDLSELGFKNADEAEAFIADAAEGMSLEGHFIKPRTDRRITEWQVSDDLYKAITGAIEAEKNQRSEKNAPDHTEAVARSNEKATLIKALSDELYRTAIYHRGEPWFDGTNTDINGPFHTLHRMQYSAMDRVAETAVPEEQVAILQEEIKKIQAVVDAYRQAYTTKQAQ